jgi:hypothetical protein
MVSTCIGSRLVMGPVLYLCMERGWTMQTGTSSCPILPIRFEW